MTFDARTATPAEFEAEARRLHAGRLARINAMTAEEQAACSKFMMPGYLQRAATLRVNELFGPEDLERQIAVCVEHWKRDNFQSSAEYEAERRRLVEADRKRAQAKAEEDARLAAAEANARARWIDQGNDPEMLELKPERRVSRAAVDVEKKGRESWIVVDGKAVGRARSRKDAAQIADALTL